MNNDTVLIYTIPIFAILGIYFFIRVLLGEYPPKIKNIIYLAGIFVLLTIIIPWTYIRIATGAIAFILLWSSLFLCNKKKDIIYIALSVTFLMFPILILFCFFYAMGWAFNHSSNDMKPYAFKIYAGLIYLIIIWLPALIKCTYINVKNRKIKAQEIDKKETQEKVNNSKFSFFKIDLSGTIFITTLLFYLMSSLKLGHILIHPISFIFVLIQVPLIVVLLTIVIIAKSSSKNIKTTLILGGLILFCFPLYPKMFLFCALMISFIFYLVSTISANNIKEIMVISAVNLLIAITAARSFFYYHHTSLAYAELGQTFFTVSTFIVLLTVIVLTAYIKYSKIKEIQDKSNPSVA